MSLTRYLEQSQKLFDSDPLEELNGTILWPEYSGTASIAYKLDNWKFTYGLDWIGSMDSYAYAEEDPKTSIYDFAVPSYFEHRISVRYLAETWDATMGVRNLTNETPPTISSLVYDRVGNAPLYSGYDYAGREVFVNLLYHF